MSCTLVLEQQILKMLVSRALYISNRSSPAGDVQSLQELQSANANWATGGGLWCDHGAPEGVSGCPRAPRSTLRNTVLEYTCLKDQPALWLDSPNSPSSLPMWCLLYPMGSFNLWRPPWLKGTFIPFPHVGLLSLQQHHWHKSAWT